MQDLIDKIVELIDLRQKATPGSWAASTRASGTGFTGNVWQDGPNSIQIVSPGLGGNQAREFIENARFIAAAGSIDFEALHTALTAPPAPTVELEILRDTEAGNAHDSPEAGRAEVVPLINDWRDTLLVALRREATSVTQGGSDPFLHEGDVVDIINDSCEELAQKLAAASTSLAIVGETPQGWISVEEQLPDKEQTVLIWARQRHDNVWRSEFANYRPDAIYSMAWETHTRGWLAPGPLVTHWQPLPAAPLAPTTDEANR